jgi:hypothetical protein
MNLKTIVAGFQLRHQKGGLKFGEFSFPDSLKTPKHILVCLPGGLRELTLVKQFLPMLGDIFRSADITLLAMPGVRVSDIYPRKGFNILSPSPEQVTWSGIAKKSFLKLLSDYKFDVIIDLNFEYSQFTSSVLLNFPNAIRVGKGNHRGEPYYNLEIKTRYLRDERNIYKSLFDTLGAIRGSGSPASPTSLPNH